MFSKKKIIYLLPFFLYAADLYSGSLQKSQYFLKTNYIELINSNYVGLFFISKRHFKSVNFSNNQQFIENDAKRFNDTNFVGRNYDEIMNGDNYNECGNEKIKPVTRECGWGDIDSPERISKSRESPVKPTGPVRKKANAKG